ncbi:MAG: aldehyde dehydrogenase family protein [Polyangiaceae bacterium]
MTATSNNTSAVTGPSAPEPSQLDATLERLRAHKREFARLGPARKAELLRRVRARFYDRAEPMVELGNRAKGVTPGTPAAGEEWFSGPTVSLRALRTFEQALNEVAQHGAPVIGDAQRGLSAHGRALVTLAPRDGYDAVLFPGWRAEGWFEAGVQPHEISRYQAGFYRQTAPEGHVVLVLGAGNVGSISVYDVLYHMFAEGGVCLLKMSPVNAYLGPLYEQAFAPLIDKGYLAITYGGADIGRYLVEHAAVDSIHVTGSVDTHDHIVWGPPGAEREQRQRDGRPLTQKRITSELGNVSPVIVPPLRYTDAELSAAARNVAGMFVNNAGFNCNAAKLLVTSRDWPQREDFGGASARF